MPALVLDTIKIILAQIKLMPFRNGKDKDLSLLIPVPSIVHSLQPAPELPVKMTDIS